jgi:hypothetical protein
VTLTVLQTTAKCREAADAARGADLRAYRRDLPDMASNLFIDHAVDVSVVLEYPTEALHPILQHLVGWEKARTALLLLLQDLQMFCRDT